MIARFARVGECLYAPKESLHARHFNNNFINLNNTKKKRWTTMMNRK